MQLIGIAYQGLGFATHLFHRPRIKPAQVVELRRVARPARGHSAAEKGNLRSENDETELEL